MRHLFDKQVFRLSAFCLKAFYLSAMSGLLYAASLQATPIFNDESTNVWLVNPQNQAVTSYSLGAWVQDYSELQGFTPNSPTQVLVNGLQNSSLPMSPMQAGVSIIGLGKADFDSATYAGPSALYVLPSSGSSTGTIEVVMQVSAELVEQSPVTLTWQINGAAVNSYTLTSTQDPNSNGLYGKRFYLIADGAYEVLVTLSQAGQLLEEKRASYSIVSDDPLKEKRDTDGDGVPDFIEAQLGFDPNNSELFTDSDEDGWSDFDLWLRCEDIEISNCNAPLDSDGDGWSDFDEALRGTEVNDFVLPLGNAASDDESYNQAKLSLQQKPAARRLYEVEYTLSGDLGDNKFSQIEAAELTGTAIFNLQSFVTQEALAALSVSANDITPSLLMSNALNSIDSAQWPAIRLAASKPFAIRATKAITAPSDTENLSQEISLLLMDGAGDVNIQDFPNTLNGQWNSIEQWRSLLIDWLKTQLVVEKQVPFSANTSLAGLLFEASLREEALLLGENQAIRLGSESLPATWISDLNRAMQNREQQSLFSWYARLANNLDTSAVYAPLVAATKEILGNMPISGTNASEWLIARLRMPVILADQGCFVSSEDLAIIQAEPEYYPIYLQSCPEFYTDLELLGWQTQANARRYLLRMTVFEDGPTQLAQSASLQQFDNDSDTDSLLNIEETLQTQYELSSYPWLADTDADGISDIMDECRIDPFNLCAGNPTQAQISLGADLSISVNNEGGVAFLELVLGFPALTEITFTYFIEAANALGDTAIDGIDFNAASGTLSIQPGQQSILIPVDLLASEVAGDVSFRMRIEDLVGASLAANTDNVQLVNVNRSIANPPTIVLAVNSFDINERAQVSFDASASTSGISDPSISYLWTQSAGPSASISGNNTSSASIVAPVVTAAVELRFSVNAQNASGGQANATVRVLVNPVDDPPVISGSANYSVARNDSLSIPKDELLALVSEPDGEVLSITQVVQSISEGGTLTETTNSFEFTPDAATGRVVYQLANDPLDVRAWINNGIAYRTADVAADPRVYKIHTWTPEQGSQVIDENTTGYSSIVTSIENEIIYYSRSNPDTSTTWIKWRRQDGSFDEIDTGGFGSLFGAQVDANTGALYHCFNDQWERIDPQTANVDRINLECNRFGAGQALMDDNFCLTGKNGLYCSENGFVFEQVFELPVSFATIDRIFSSEIGTLVLYNDNTNQFIAHIDGQSNGQLLYTLDNYFNYIQGIWLDDTFYTVLPVNRSIFDQGVQLFKWQAGDTELVPVGEPDLFSDQISRTEFGELVVLGDNLLWFGQKSLSANAKFLINKETGEFSQAGEDVSGSRNLHAYNNTALFSSERLETSCQWFELDENGLVGATPELEQASCFGRLVYGSTLAYTYFNQALNYNEFYVKYGASAVSQTQFVVRVEDENGNAVNLTVNIAISEGAQ